MNNAPELTYTFEKIAGGDMYQVRLGGEFVTYSSTPSAEKIDNILLSRGFPSREAFFNESLAGNAKAVPFKNTLVLIESPFAGNVEANINYARKALRDSLLRGEAPFASHLLYTQDGVLDDTVPEQRTHGIEAGLAWGAMAEKTVVYTDLGITPGMELGIERAKKENRPVEYRSLTQ